MRGEWPTDAVVGLFMAGWQAPSRCTPLRLPGLDLDGGVRAGYARERHARRELGQALRVDLPAENGFQHLRLFEDAGKDDRKLP